MVQKVVIVPNLGPEFDVGTLVPNAITIRVDGVTLKRDAITGELSVDVTAMTVVSADADNYLVAGSDAGAYLSKEQIQDAIGEMVISATDGLTYNDALNALSASVADALGVDTSSIDMTAALNAGVLEVFATVIFDPGTGNLAKDIGNGVLVLATDVADAVANLTTLDSVLTAAGLTTSLSINGAAVTDASVVTAEPLQDAFGVAITGPNGRPVYALEEDV